MTVAVIMPVITAMGLDNMLVQMLVTAAVTVVGLTLFHARQVPCPAPHVMPERAPYLLLPALATTEYPAAFKASTVASRWPLSRVSMTRCSSVPLAGRSVNTR